MSLNAPHNDSVEWVGLKQGGQRSPPHRHTKIQAGNRWSRRTNRGRCSKQRKSAIKNLNYRLSVHVLVHLGAHSRLLKASAFIKVADLIAVDSSESRCFKSLWKPHTTPVISKLRARTHTHIQTSPRVTPETLMKHTISGVCVYAHKWAQSRIKPQTKRKSVLKPNVIYLFCTIFTMCCIKTQQVGACRVKWL